jgi:beta-lactamase class A
MSPILSKKLSIFYTLLLVVVSCIATFVITSFIKKNKNEVTNQEVSEAGNSCKYKVKRLDGYSYIKPIMFVDDECEGDNLATSKQEINEIIENYKMMQGVISASVYIRDYNNGTWTTVNDELQYEPGSLFKVPILIAYLKMNEEKPGTLDKELSFEQPFAIDKNVAFHSKSIQLGHKYKIRELLKYMISYSDNNATALLNNNLKADVLTKLFADLNLEIPDIKAQHYYFTAKQYSLFMRALYNASYLSIDDSEFAAELLGTCDFKDGIVSGLPNGTKIAHKFGESGTPIEMQLHESAIVYIKDKPYLLTVMTKGKDNKTLAKLIGEISAIVYKNLINQ